MIWLKLIVGGTLVSCITMAIQTAPTKHEMYVTIVFVMFLSIISDTLLAILKKVSRT